MNIGNKEHKVYHPRGVRIQAEGEMFVPSGRYTLCSIAGIHSVLALLLMFLVKSPEISTD